jgi:hypothetical protein
LISEFGLSCTLAPLKAAPAPAAGEGANAPKMDSLLPSTAAAGNPASASLPNSRLLYAIVISSVVQIEGASPLELPLAEAPSA